MKKDVISQGDVTFLPAISKLPNGNRRKIVDGVIARGETSGHSHRIEVLANAELVEIDGNLFLEVGENGVRIVHEEHKIVQIDPGIHPIHIDQTFEYSAQALRNVVD